MPYFAAALARRPSGWTAAELDLDGVDDVLSLTDLMREVEERAEVTLLFLEEDDLYVAIVRIDNGEDPRIFVSDVRAGDESKVAEMLLEEVGRPVPVPFSVDDDDIAAADVEPDAVDDDAAESIDVIPAGDSDLLADLGTPAGELLALCAHEGLLPADVITAVAERAGCLDELEEIREG
ncbi:MAG: tRNA adenosine deaminase-associated protein [bacterium]